jgi:NAD(P)-dependent dehydrogenase (short-subunit alcohol dehydrogenase family)
MKTIVITGSQTGMGWATRKLLERTGVRVIGVSDTGDAEVIADLSTEAGVEEAVARIEALSDGPIDGVFANAGVDSENAPLVFGLNYFGIVRMLDAKAASQRWAGSGMNVLAPGVVMTQLIERDMLDPRKAAGIKALPMPLGSFPGPENVASLVRFLLVDDARFIVGQYLIIEGGTEVALRGHDLPRSWDIAMEEFRTLLLRAS